MWKRNIAVVLSVLFVSVQSISAAAINMIVCQEEADASIVLPVRKTSQQIETVILDALFDSGHIVTNENIVNGETRESGIRAGLLSARDSYMDFYVVVTTHYTGESVDAPGKVSLESIKDVELTIRRIRTDAIVCQETIVPVQKAKETSSQGVDRFGKELAYKICREITASK
ncbi:MAG: hypothetical protein MJ178_08585 [Treponemataceae bacterium]|nr:hypothetical protein [Treponemataceae bacterium]